MVRPSKFLTVLYDRSIKVGNHRVGGKSECY